MKRRKRMPFAAWIAALLLISAGPVLAAGTWAPLGLGIKGSWVGYMLVWNGELVVSGEFDTAGGIPARNIAVWDGANWSALGAGWARIYAMATYNGQLAVHGVPTGGTSVVIATWDGAVWTAVTTTNFAGLASFNGKLYQAARGTYPVTFDTWSAIWEYDAGTWQRVASFWADDLDGRSSVDVLTVIGSQLYAYVAPYGEITSFDGSGWTSLGTTGDSWGLDIVEADSTLYSLSRDVIGSSIVRRFGGGSWNLLFYQHSGFNVDDIIVFQGKVTIGGESWPSSTGRIDTWDGASWTTLSTLPARVFQLADYDGTLIAAGVVDTAGTTKAYIGQYVDIPTPVAISSFSAAPDGAAVSLSWNITADETFSGFDVYRREIGGIDQRVNASRLSPNTRSYVDRTVAAGKRYSYQLIAVGAVGGEFRSQRAKIALPALSATLRQNVPNPFNPETTIRFVIPSENTVTITVYGAHGEKVRTLVERRYAPGEWAATWDGTDDAGRRVASGVYYYRMRIGSVEQSKKMVLIK